MNTVTVLGAGLAGLAAVQQAKMLGWQTVLYEKNFYLGGHATSFSRGNFIFDEGIHTSFTSDPTIREMFHEAVQGEYREQVFKTSNYWKGYYLSHPIACHLMGLPASFIQRAIDDFVAIQQQPKIKPSNYAEWCYQNFGKTLSEEFIFRYTRKYWTISPDQLTLDWIGDRIYIPSLAEIQAGARKAVTPTRHYIQHMRYPKEGGFGAYLGSFQQLAPLHYGYEVQRIDLASKTLAFKNGVIKNFQHLISSLPLPELIKCLSEVPDSITEASKHLRSTALIVVTLGILGNKVWPPGHLIYFYDEDLIFSRCSFPERLAASNVPAGYSSIQLEIYLSATKPLSINVEKADILNRVYADLIKINFLSAKDKIEMEDVRYVPYANVIFDHQRKTNLAKIKDFLAKHHIISCGRYGDWEYYWSDDSIRSGWRAVEQLREKQI